jgi:hypothetical protein
VSIIVWHVARDGETVSNMNETMANATPIGR